MKNYWLIINDIYNLFLSKFFLTHKNILFTNKMYIIHYSNRKKIIIFLPLSIGHSEYTIFSNKNNKNLEMVNISIIIIIIEKKIVFFCWCVMSEGISKSAYHHTASSSFPWSIQQQQKHGKFIYLCWNKTKQINKTKLKNESLSL